MTWRISSGSPPLDVPSHRKVFAVRPIGRRKSYSKARKAYIHEQSAQSEQAGKTAKCEVIFLSQVTRSRLPRLT